MHDLTTYSETRWTQAIDAAIREMTDFAASQQFGIRRAAIMKRRRELGIVRSPDAGPKWTAARTKLLGTALDTELAAKWNIGVYHVRQRRILHGIPPFQIPPVPESEVSRRPPHQWTKKEEALLGTQPDTVIADRLDLDPGVVTVHRNRLGILPFRRGGPVEWTEGMLRLLGDVPDGTLAKEYEVSHASVKIKRIEEGIPPYGQDEMDVEPVLPLAVLDQIGKVPDNVLARVHRVSRVNLRIYRALHGIPLAPYHPAERRVWKKSEDQLLGTMSDGRAAARIGTTRGQAMLRRKRLKIPAFGQQASIRWTRSRLEQLGQVADHVLARQWKISQTDVRKKREAMGIPPSQQKTSPIPAECYEQLGKAADTQVARQFSLSPTMIRNLRQQAGIPPFRSSAPFDWTKSRCKLLGKKHDEDLAAEWGVSPQFVAAKRQELKIPVYRRVRKIDWNDSRTIRLLGTMSDGQLAKQLSVTPGAVRIQRVKRNIPPFEKPK